jgi:hypothetical protein
MARGISLEQQYTAGFVRWNWWHADPTANRANKKETLFFDWECSKAVGELIDVTQFILSMEGPPRPTCPECDAYGAARLELRTFECLCCGHVFESYVNFIEED